MKKSMVILCAMFLFLGFSTSASADSTTFYLSPGTNPMGDKVFQAAGLALSTSNSLIEEDLEQFKDRDFIDSLSMGPIQVGISLSGIFDSKKLLIFDSVEDYPGGVDGTVYGNGLINVDEWSRRSSVMLRFSEGLVQGFGVWIYDDSTETTDAFRMTVWTKEGEVSTSGVLDSNYGSGAHTVEGFIGALASNGIDSVLIEQGTWDGSSSSSFVARGNPSNFDLDHFQVISPGPKPVSIDIMPGKHHESINLHSHGEITVAILSTPGFYASDIVDKDSLTFGRTGTEDSLAFCYHRPEDINEDGLEDLVCHFYTEDTGFQCGDTEGILKGTTKDGMHIQGSDSVKIIPCKKPPKK